MIRRLALPLLIALTTGTASAAGPERPDLQGVWNFSSGIPLQRPAAFAGKTVLTKEEFDRQVAATRNALLTIAKFAPVEAVGLELLDSTPMVEDLRSSLITYPESGRLPALVAGVKRMPGPEDFIAALADPKGPAPDLAAALAAFGGGKKDSYRDFSGSERCLFGADVPLVPQLGDNYIEIIQSRDHVVLVTDSTRRIVTINGRFPDGDALRTWSGTSIGHWDGETLVVETRHFNDRTRSFAGAGTAHDKVVTERFTRRAGNVLQYTATVVDPKTFQDRIELSFPMALVDARIYEAACHEGNYSLPLALSGARKAEADAAASRVR